MQTRSTVCRWLAALVAVGAMACGKVDPIGSDDGGSGGHAGAGGSSGGSGSGAGGGGGGVDGGGGGCGGLDEGACTARSDCKAYYCASCSGPTFAACSTPDVPPPIACPSVACPSPCSQVTTLSECEARTDCHSVFVDPGTCGCATVGCCAHFSFCASGDQAQCHGTVACAMAPPFCESPAYVVSYVNNCYEGCVQAKDCAP
jgi:hypothetical protein